MKIPLDSSVLVKTCHEKSKSYISFFDRISFLNELSHSTAIYLCVNREIKDDYDKVFRSKDIPYSTTESYEKWYKQFFMYFEDKGGQLNNKEEKLTDCEHPVEHALIAFAIKYDKCIVVDKESSSFQKRCFHSKSKVISFINEKEIKVLSIQEMLAKFMDNFSVTPRKISNFRKLRQNIMGCFNKNELRMLCYDLSLPTENLIVDTLDDSITNIIGHLQRRRRSGELLSYLIEERPNVEWVEDNE